MPHPIPSSSGGQDAVPDVHQTSILDAIHHAHLPCGRDVYLATCRQGAGYTHFHMFCSTSQVLNMGWV